MRGLLAAMIAMALPALATADPAPVHYPAGATAFQANCSVCHGVKGAGTPSLAPPITSYPARYAASAEGRRQLAMTVLYGLSGEITVDDKHFDFKMPDFSRLDDAALAATMREPQRVACDLQGLVEVLDGVLMPWNVTVAEIEWTGVLFDRQKCQDFLEGTRRVRDRLGAALRGYGIANPDSAPQLADFLVARGLADRFPRTGTGRPSTAGFCRRTMVSFSPGFSPALIVAARDSARTFSSLSLLSAAFSQMVFTNALLAPTRSLNEARLYDSERMEIRLRSPK